VLWEDEGKVEHVDAESTCAEVHRLSTHRAGCARRSKGKGQTATVKRAVGQRAKVKGQRSGQAPPAPAP
jgi:hypothetical protein